MKKAFTMIELVFVIVILGILASVAIPRLAATRDDAKIAKMAQQIASATAEIQGMSVAKGKVDAPEEMSQVLLQLVKQGKAVVSSDSPISGSVGQLTLYSQNGGNADDHAFIIDLNVTTLVIKHGTPCAGVICKTVQNRISEGNYSVGGDRVVF